MSKVYFIRPVGMLAPVKIGWSDSPYERLKVLACWSPFPLEIAATVDGGLELERRLHTKFLHAHSHREWFLADAELVAGIERLRNGASLDEAFDLVGIKPKRRVVLRRESPPEVQRSRSYRLKVSALERRASRQKGEVMVVTREISAIVSARYGEPLSDGDCAKLDEVLARPDDFLIPLRTKYSDKPQEVAA